MTDNTKKLENNSFSWSGMQLRALNELPTLFLVIVVMLVAFQWGRYEDRIGKRLNMKVEKKLD